MTSPDVQITAVEQTQFRDAEDTREKIATADQQIADNGVKVAEQSKIMADYMRDEYSRSGIWLKFALAMAGGPNATGKTAQQISSLSLEMTDEYFRIKGMTPPSPPPEPIDPPPLPPIPPIPPVASDDPNPYARPQMPKQVAAGSTVRATIVFHNDGSFGTWLKGEIFAIPLNGTYGHWGVPEIPIERTIEPGIAAAFTANFQAMPDVSAHPFEWQMARRSLVGGLVPFGPIQNYSPINTF